MYLVLHRVSSWLVSLQDILQANVIDKRMVTMYSIVHVYRNVSAYTCGIALAYVHIFLYMYTQTHATVYCLSFYIPGNLGKNKPLICATISFHFMQFPLIIIEHHIASRWYRAPPNCKLLNAQCVYHYSIVRKSMFSCTHRKNTWLIDTYTLIHNMCLHMRVSCARRESLARRLRDHLQKSGIEM